MSSVNPFVIVGGGLAAGKAAEALREHGHSGPLLIVGDEQERPYIRCPRATCLARRSVTRSSYTPRTGIRSTKSIYSWARA